MEFPPDVRRVDADARGVGREGHEGDRASEKARWCELDLPFLAARGYPVPSIVWHGSLNEGWHVVAQRRLAGRSLRLTWPLLDQVVGLVELQAMANALPASEDRDFADYISSADSHRDASVTLERTVRPLAGNPTPDQPYGTS